MRGCTHGGDGVNGGAINPYGETLFASFAPDGAPWSPWVKPVLFAALATGEPAPTEEPTPLDVAWAPSPPADTLVVVDLPGARAVQAGMALAERGFRPIPLFNGTPGLKPAVATRGIVEALTDAAPRLGALALPLDAPPAFLLDRARRGKGYKPEPGSYDNRWMTFPQDFPSANLLLARGLRRAIVWLPALKVPDDDLQHVLRRWQEAGIRILLQHDGASAPAEPYAVPRPNAFRAAWYVALAMFGLGRSDVGGFGTRVPIPPPPGTSRGFYG